MRDATGSWGRPRSNHRRIQTQDLAHKVLGCDELDSGEGAEPVIVARREVPHVVAHNEPGSRSHCRRPDRQVIRSREPSPCGVESWHHRYECRSRLNIDPGRRSACLAEVPAEQALDADANRHQVAAGILRTDTHGSRRLFRTLRAAGLVTITMACPSCTTVCVCYSVAARCNRDYPVLDTSKEYA